MGFYAACRDTEGDDVAFGIEDVFCSAFCFAVSTVACIIGEVYACVIAYTPAIWACKLTNAVDACLSVSAFDVTSTTVIRICFEVAAHIAADGLGFIALEFAFAFHA